MDMLKLRNIQQVLEKSISATLAHLKKSEYHQDIANYSEELSKERKERRDVLNEKIKETLELLEDKFKLLKENRIADITDFKQFKTEMILTQEKIQNLRTEAKTNLECLRKECVEINEDVDFYKELMPKWSEVTTDHTYVYPKKKTESLRGLKCKETKDFIEFVHKSNGHENGWRKDDHQMFLRFRKKLKNPDKLAKALHDNLPDLTIEEIKGHEEWYKQYLLLKTKKEDVIREWKKNKNQIRPHSSTSLVDHHKVLPTVLSQEEIKEKVLKWKQEKQQEIMMTRENEKIQEQRQKEMEQVQKRRNEQLRKLVEEWKITKMLLEQTEAKKQKLSQENEKKQRAAEANQMIKLFQSQDDLYISKMLKQRRRDEIMKPVRSKSSQLAKRDPHRLLKPTKQWINRVHDENIYSGESTLVPLRRLPKLCIPEWRKKAS